MTTDEILLDAEERMEKAANVFRDELRGLRTGRASPALLDAIRVEYYGSPTPIKQLAQVSTPDPQQIVVRPFDQNALKDIEKAIRSSDLGLAPNNDGKVIRDNLRVMDTAAIDLCREARLPILVFNFKREGNIERAIAGHAIGTLVSDQA